MMKTSIPKMHLPEKQRICPGSDFPSLLAVAAGCFCLPVALATGAPMLEGVVWEEDFESGSVAGWESYPSFQDTAYDFTLYPGRYIGPGELRGNIFSGGDYYPPVGVAPPPGAGENSHYLVRGHKPEGMQGQRLGMWVKTPGLWSDDGMSVSFDYWLEDRLGGSALEVHLAGGDGTRYKVRLDSVARDWTGVTLSREEFRSPDGQSSLPGDVSIDAIAILMDMEETDPTAYAYLAVDNVRIEGRQPVRPAYETPVVSRYQHWKHALVEEVLEGEQPLDLALRLPGGAATVNLDLSFGFDGEGRHTVSLEESGGLWLVPGGFVFGADDPFGPWEGKLVARMADGTAVEDTLRLWRLDTPPAERPRLLFSADEVDSLRERAGEGDSATVFDAIRSRAERGRGEMPPEEADISIYLDDYLLRDIVSYFAVLRTPSVHAKNNAFVYLIDGDEEAGEYAREAMLRMTSWDTWLHPNFSSFGRNTYYPIGIVSINLALAYDMIQPLLSEADKEAIREGMMRNAVRSGWNEYFRHNRVGNHTSNWISGTTAGPVLSILSMYDSPSDFPVEFHGLAEKWFAHINATYLPDGSYGEGYSYGHFSAYKGQSSLAALANAYGADEIISTINFHEAFTAPIYITIGGHTALEMGDNYVPLTRTFHQASWSAHSTGDPLVNYWYSLNPGNDWRVFVWPLNEDNVGHPRDFLSPSRIFPDRGSAVFRTNWEEDGVALHFRAGPNFNHTHADQGHFNMWAYGELVALEGEIAMYYDDPYFWSYNIHAGAHNVLIIDENMQSQEFGDFADEVPAFDNHARMVATAIDESAGLVLSDLTAPYARHLQQYQRALAFTPGGNLIVWDNLRTHGGVHQLDFQYHPPVAGRTMIEGTQAVYSGESARLNVDVLYPSNARVAEQRVPTGLRELREHPNPPAERQYVVRMGTPEPASSAEFLTAYLPSRLSDEPGNGAEYLDLPDGHGVRLMEGNVEVTAFQGRTGVVHGELQTDGSMLMVAREGGSITRLWALQATMVTIGDSPVHASDEPMDVVLEPGEGGTWNSVAR